MADDSTTGDGTETGQGGQGNGQAGDDWESSEGRGGKQAVLAELAEARKARRAAEKEIEKLRAASLSDQERAVAEAKLAGANEASAAVTPRLVRAELRAAAADAGLPKEALDGFLEYADLNRFVKDGEPDDKAIAAAVKRLAGGAGKPADFDGGARGGTAKPLDMSALIRQKAGVGI